MNSRRLSGLTSFLSLLICLFGLFLVLAPTVSIASTPVDKLRAGASSAASVSGIPTSTSSQAPGVLLEQTAGRLVGLVLSFVGVLFFGLAMYGGVLWMFARGNEEQGRKSVAIITSAVSGLIVVVGSYAITSFVFEDVLKKGEVDNNSQQVNNGNINNIDEILSISSSQSCTTNAGCLNNDICQNGVCVNACGRLNNGNSTGFACRDRSVCNNTTVRQGLCPGDSSFVCCQLINRCVYVGSSSTINQPNAYLICQQITDRDLCNFRPFCRWE